MKQGYYKDFCTKREFLKWIEEHIEEIDFDYDVRIEYYKEDDE